MEGSSSFWSLGRAEDYGQSSHRGIPYGESFYFSGAKKRMIRRYEAHILSRHQIAHDHTADPSCTASKARKLCLSTSPLAVSRTVGFTGCSINRRISAWIAESATVASSGVIRRSFRSLQIPDRASICEIAETTLFRSFSPNQNCSIGSLPTSYMRSFRKALVSMK